MRGLLGLDRDAEVADRGVEAVLDRAERRALAGDAAERVVDRSELPGDSSRVGPASPTSLEPISDSLPKPRDSELNFRPSRLIVIVSVFSSGAVPRVPTWIDVLG